MKMTEVASFSVKFLQYLDENGQIVQELPAIAQDHETLRMLYEKMTLVRYFDKKAVALQRTGNLGTFPSLLGQEAIPIIMGHVMDKQDVLCPNYRNQGELLMRGTTMTELFTYWGGDERGSNFANNQFDMPLCIPIGTQCQHGVGVAYAMKLRREKRVAVVSIGDGGTSEGAFYESINAAGVWQLPMVFLVNNNQWAISVPRNKQTGTQTIAQKAIAAGLDCIQVDGNDVFALHSAATAALNQARNGGRATIIEAITYRLCPHTTADDATRYVPEQDLAAAWKIEPILRLKNYMMAHGFWSEEEQTTLDEKCKNEVDEAVQAYLQRPLDSPQAMMADLFHEVPEPFKAQFDALGELA